MGLLIKRINQIKNQQEIEEVNDNGAIGNKFKVFSVCVDLKISEYVIWIAGQITQELGILKNSTIHHEQKLQGKLVKYIWLPTKYYIVSLIFYAICFVLRICSEQKKRLKRSN